MRLRLGDYFDDEEEGGDLFYEVVSSSNAALLERLEIDVETGELLVVPGADESGVATVGIGAEDGGGLRVEALLTVVVTPVNDAPTGLAVPAVTADGEASDIVVALAGFFTDADVGDMLSYSLPGRKSGIFESLSIGAESGELRARFVETMAGTAYVRVVATDSAGATGDTVLAVVLGVGGPLEVVVGRAEAVGAGGEWVQEIAVKNAGERDVAGFEVVVSGIADGISVDGGTVAGGSVVVGWPGLLGAGRERTVVLRYRGGGGDGPGAVSVAAGIVYGVGRSGFRVRAVEVDGKQLVLRFPTREGSLYRVESGEPIGRWEIVGEVVRGDGREVEWRWSMDPAVGRRLFRVVELGSGR